jgi:hypothetical protein
MKNKTNLSRRNFLKNTSLGIGGGLVGASLISCNSSPGKRKMPREVCLASIDLKGLWPDTTTESRIKRILKRMEDVTGLNPDLICLPETFDTIWVQEQRTTC